MHVQNVQKHVRNTCLLSRAVLGRHPRIHWPTYRPHYQAPSCSSKRHHVLSRCNHTGATENARHENAGLENAGMENTAQNCMAGKCETGKCGTKMQDVKMQEWKIRHKKSWAGKCEKSQYGKRTDALYSIKWIIVYWHYGSWCPSVSARPYTHTVTRSIFLFMECNLVQFFFRYNYVGFVLASVMTNRTLLSARWLVLLGNYKLHVGLMSTHRH